MNKTQQFAYDEPCYMQEDLDSSIYNQKTKLGRFDLITKVRVMAFLGNELWRATAIVSDEAGNVLKSTGVNETEKSEINALLYEMLENVGVKETYPFDLESDFEIIRMLTGSERKDLPQPNLHKLLKVEERQNFALKNPSLLNLMLAKKYGLEIDLGGAIFNTVLTVEKTENVVNWHASASVQGKDKTPVKVFGGMTVEQGKMCMDMMLALFENVGYGHPSTFKPEKGGRVMHLWKKATEREIAKMPNRGASDLLIKSPFALTSKLN